MDAPEGTDDLITVKAGPKSEKGKVAIWDRDPRHPEVEGEHEVWINGGSDDVCQVYPNAAVQEKLRLGILQEAKGEEAPRSGSKSASTPEADTETESAAPAPASSGKGSTSTNRNP